MRKTWIILLGLLLLAAPAATQAQNYDYETNADGLSVTITAYLGPGGNVTIPSTIAGLPVNNIAEKAFEETGLTSVTIPDGVTNLGSWSFFTCPNLTNVTIPGSVISIGASAFDYCTSLSSVTIPEGVTSIGSWAFADCTALSSVTLSDGITNIGSSAFFECDSLGSINIPDGVTSIGITAFYNCTSLTSATIPGSVTSIGIQAFQTCTSLTNVSMAEGITNIGESAFNYCTSLSSVTIPNSVTTIGVEAFQSCVALSTVTIPASVQSIGDIAFSDCYNLGDVFFDGNAPAPGVSIFLYATNAKAFYLPGTTGWKSTYAGIPAQLLPTNTINVTFTPPRAGVKVSGGGHFTRGSQVTVTASTTNDCYEFVGWVSGRKIVSTNLDYTFMAKGNETLLADFALIGYTISTSSSPSNWGVTLGAGRRNCGATAIIAAVPRPGFAFVGWTSSFGDTITNSHYRFSVSGNESFVANFMDIRKPAVRITAPRPNEKVTTAAFTLEGTASDNAAVAAVYYNLNDAGWQPASSSNGFKSWFADVTLNPDSANTVAAYAVDTSSNLSATVGPVTLTCTAPGLALVSVSGTMAEEILASDTGEYFPISFDSAAYAKMPGSATDEGEVGIYTYTLTGPDSAELAQRRLLPTRDNGADGSVLELKFTDAYHASFTNLVGGAGSIYFGPTLESVPANLDGGAKVIKSFVNSNYFSTNAFGHSTFTTTDSLGETSSGTYTFTRITPVAALIEETYTSPSEKVGMTNCLIMTFKEGASKSEGVYYSELLDASGKRDSDVGSFQ